MAIGYNTLLIEALAKHLASRRDKGKDPSLETLCEQLEQAGALRLPATDAVDVDWQNRQGHTPEALLEALFDLSGLDETDSALLLRLSLLPSEPMQPPFLYPLFGVQPNSPEEAVFDERLAGLARGGWLEWQAGEGYRVHPLTAGAVRKRLLSGCESCADLIEQLISLLEQAHLGVRAQYTEAARSLLGWLEKEKSGRLALLTAYLADTLKELGDYREMESLLQKAHELFLDAEDISNAAVIISRLGEYFQTIGNFEQALEFFLKDLQLTEELFKANPKSESLKNGLAISYEKLGSIYQAQGNFEQALEFFLKQTNLFEELFKANPRSAELFKGLGVSYFKLGQLLGQLARPEESRQYLEQALHIFTQLAELTRIPQYAGWAAHVRSLLEAPPDQPA